MSILWDYEVDEILGGDADVIDVRMRGVALGLTSDLSIDGVLLLIIISPP